MRQYPIEPYSLDTHSSLSKFFHLVCLIRDPTSRQFERAMRMLFLSGSLFMLDVALILLFPKFATITLQSDHRDTMGHRRHRRSCSELLPKL